MAAGDVAKAIEAIRAGQAVLLPADGVYGLCASAYREGPARRLYEVKGRDAGQPSAMIAASVEMLIECVPETIGVRVANLPRDSQYVLDAVGAVAATSANDPGQSSPASLDEVPAGIRAGCGAEIDAGRLSGLASTVIDFTGLEPVVLRVGAGDPEEAIALADEALAVSRTG